MYTPGYFLEYTAVQGGQGRRFLPLCTCVRPGRAGLAVAGASFASNSFAGAYNFQLLMQWSAVRPSNPRVLLLLTHEKTENSQRVSFTCLYQAPGTRYIPSRRVHEIHSSYIPGCKIRAHYRSCPSSARTTPCTLRGRRRPIDSLLACTSGPRRQSQLAVRRTRR